VSYLVANSTVGSRIPLDVIRGGRRQIINVVVLQRPTEEELARANGANPPGNAPGGGEVVVAPQRTLGLSLAPLTPELARAGNLPAGARGVIVTAVDPNSAAAEEGLQRGDLIVSVGNQIVASPDQVIAAVEVARRAGRPSVLLLVRRGNSPETFIGVDITGR
jgi:serine protease Do